MLKFSYSSHYNVAVTFYRRRLEVCERHPLPADRTAIGNGVCDGVTAFTATVADSTIGGTFGATICDRAVDTIGGRLFFKSIAVCFTEEASGVNSFCATVAIGATVGAVVEGSVFTAGSIVNCCILEIGAIAVGPVLRIEGASTRSPGVSDRGFSNGFSAVDGGATYSTGEDAFPL